MAWQVDPYCKRGGAADYVYIAVQEPCFDYLPVVQVNSCVVKCNTGSDTVLYHISVGSKEKTWRAYSANLCFGPEVFDLGLPNSGTLVLDSSTIAQELWR